MNFVCSVTGLNHHLTAEEIQNKTNNLVEKYQKLLDDIISNSDETKTFSNTFGALANADSQLASEISVCTLPALVRSGNENQAVREAAVKSKQTFAQMWNSAYRRKDLYNVLKQFSDNNNNNSNSSKSLISDTKFSTWTDEEKLRFIKKTLKRFERGGSSLNDEQLKQVNSIATQLSNLCTNYEQLINENRDQAEFTRNELKGVPETFIDSLPKKKKKIENQEKEKEKEEEEEEEELFLVGCKAPQLLPVMQQAVLESTRIKMRTVADSRCVSPNYDNLKEILRLRHEMALLLGYKSHAHYIMEEKMAQNPEIASNFLSKICLQLKPRLEKDIEQMKKMKKEETGNQDPQIGVHDLSHYTHKMKESLNIDENALKIFFPLNHVVSETFSIYSEILGLSFQELTNEKSVNLWDKNVKLYQVIDSEKNIIIGHFYLDLFSRDGKYGHQCVVPIRPSFYDNNGNFVTPICAILGNMTQPFGDVPSLLRFSEVSTFFHEFGHVMHTICSKSPCSLFSWAWPIVPWYGGVEQDFLEVPSMMFEQWISEKNIISRLSSHYQTHEKLNNSIIDNIIKNKNLFIGSDWSRFIAMATFDILLHSSLPPYTFDGQVYTKLDELWNDMIKKISFVHPIPNTFFAASWYHIIAGYDAGYYGYLWSEVYAHDLFSFFKGNCLNPEIGKKFRKCILEPGACKDGNEMLLNFLGREPSEKPFIEEIL